MFLSNLDADNQLTIPERRSFTYFCYYLSVIQSDTTAQGNRPSSPVSSVRSRPSLLSLHSPTEYHVFLSADSFFRASMARGNAITVPPRNAQEIPESMSGVPRRTPDPLCNGLGT